jgi:hypothetical protein
MQIYPIQFSRDSSDVEYETLAQKVLSEGFYLVDMERGFQWETLDSRLKKNDVSQTLKTRYIRVGDSLYKHGNKQAIIYY